MAVPIFQPHYDIFGLPLNSGRQHIREQLLRFASADLSDMDVEDLKVIVSENKQIVKSYGILMNNATREPYDQSLPNHDAHSIDASTSIKDWAPGPETPISESTKCKIQQESEWQTRKMKKEVPLDEIRKLVRAIEGFERTFQNWFKIEASRLKDAQPSYLGILHRRILMGMAKVGINRDKIQTELQERDRYKLLTERLKLLLKALEADLKRCREDPMNAF